MTGKSAMNDNLNLLLSHYHIIHFLYYQSLIMPSKNKRKRKQKKTLIQDYLNHLSVQILLQTLIGKYLTS